MSCWGFDFAPLSGLQTGQVASSCVSAVCNFGDLWCATISGPKTCVHVIWYYSDSTQPVPMFCFEPLLTSLHWIVRKSHGVPPLGLDAFGQTSRCWKDFLFAKCRPLLLVLGNRLTLESPPGICTLPCWHGNIQWQNFAFIRSAWPSKNHKKNDPLWWGRRIFKKSVFFEKIAP